MRNVIHASNITTYLEFAAHLNDERHPVNWELWFLKTHARDLLLNYREKK